METQLKFTGLARGLIYGIVGPGPKGSVEDQFNAKEEDRNS